MWDWYIFDASRRVDLKWKSGRKKKFDRRVKKKNRKFRGGIAESAVQVRIRRYPSIQSEQSLRNARGAILIRDERPPIGLHLSPARTVTRLLFPITRDFRIPRQNNRPWKRLPGFLTPVTATLCTDRYTPPYSWFLEYKFTLSHDLPQESWQKRPINDAKQRVARTI